MAKWNASRIVQGNDYLGVLGIDDSIIIIR